jgi:hypothetical protein
MDDPFRLLKDTPSEPLVHGLQDMNEKRSLSLRRRGVPPAAKKALAKRYKTVKNALLVQRIFRERTELFNKEKDHIFRLAHHKGINLNSGSVIWIWIWIWIRDLD